MTVEDIVRRPFERDCWKHNLAPNAEVYADECIDSLSNTELLRLISDAIETRLAGAPA
ncbi:hypothetical protein [Caulobacter phage KcrB]|nr:hypothetical protein RW_GP024 [Caulobacter phage RW]WCA46328.1 hypothetical protein [Caulobacter phage KcrB]WCD56263.1 hypothetical protein [Caulobacter phage RLK]WNV48055.1 hypothetical protein GB2A_gp023 [Caulobacter phage GB2A]